MRNNVGLLLAKRAHLSPALDGIVEVERERRFTFAGVNARCNRTANALSALGVARGDRVALLLMNPVEFTEAFFAILKLGAVVVPLNWRLVADELAFILGDSGAVALIYDEEFRRRGRLRATASGRETGGADSSPHRNARDGQGSTRRPPGGDGASFRGRVRAGPGTALRDAARRPPRTRRERLRARSPTPRLRPGPPKDLPALSNPGPCRP